MASQSVLDELSPFLLEVPGLEETARREEEQALRGSYGFVFKVTVGGVECIAKKLHSAYVNQSVSNVERQSITSKFRNECIILSKLSHPNIVKFVGVHYGSRRNDLTLIMESLRCDLHDFLLKNPNIPLSLKVSLLLDVSHGLVYLHCGPPIIHRDLTARNILITYKCQAKIADLGVAKMVTLQQQLAVSHTQTPGQMFYMPPEALKEKAECTPKLDIFSFGHLALFTSIQEFPKVYNITLTMDIQRNGIFERLKRQRSLDLVGSGHCLYPIITECLYDRPEQRPTTRDLNSRLIQLSTQHPVSARQVMPFMGEEIARVSEELKDLQQSLEVKTSEVEGLKKEKETMTQEIRDLQDEIGAYKLEADIIRQDFEQERRDRENYASRQVDEARKWRDYKQECETKIQSLEAKIRSDRPSMEEELQRNRRLEEAELRATKAEGRAREAENRLATSEEHLRDCEWAVERNEIELTGPELGCGAWGTVSVATFRGAPVAAKCFHPMVISDYITRRFKRQISMAAKLRHPNLVQFIGATMKGEELISLTELMSTSLRRELEGGPMPLEQVTSIGVDVARALNYLHLMKPHPLIHCEITSANVLLQGVPNSCWRAKVSDYDPNIAKSIQEKDDLMPGEFVYAPPEMFSLQLSPKIDIFSFGVLLVEMLTGEFPDTDKRASQLHKISNRPLLALIQSCLSQDSAKRPSASYLISQLDSIHL